MSFYYFFARLNDPLMVPYWSVVIFIFGLCVGSFLNVCIWRMPRRESVIFKASHCPFCETKITWYENIPVISWLMLCGKCRYCSRPISCRYIIIELITGILFVMVYLRNLSLHYPAPMLIPYFLASSMFIVTFVIDVKFKIIPDKITCSVIIISLITAIIFPDSVGKNSHISGFLNSFFGFVVSGSIFAIVALSGKILFQRDVFGWGDVKFLAALGACFGLYPAVWFFVIVLASFSGLLFGIALIVFKKKKLSCEIPFGPFLAAAGMVWIIYGPEIVRYYFAVNYTLINHFLINC